MVGKQKMVAKKFFTYENEVRKYHRTFRNGVRIECPSLAAVRFMKLEDSFWDIRDLNHPAEPWAVDCDTKEGIQAFLTFRNCVEELQRMA